MDNNMFDTIDATGTGRKSDPRMRNVEAEMIRSKTHRPRLQGTAGGIVSVCIRR